MNRVCNLVTAAILAAIGLSQPAKAASVSPTEPNFLLTCGEVFVDGHIAPDYVEMIVDYALPRRTRPAGSEAVALGVDSAVSDRLSKWPGKLRMVVRSDVPVIRDAFTSLRLNLMSWSRFDIEYVWDNQGKVGLKDGDLLVYVMATSGSPEAKAAGPRLNDMLLEFYGAGPELAGLPDRVAKYPALGFVDVVRNSDTGIKRAIVVLNAASLRVHGSNWLFELLTTALNPNAGNAAYHELPGGTAEEKRIYDKVWVNDTLHALVWGTEFTAYMAVLLDESVKPGMTRAQLVAAATEILNRPELQKRLFTAHNCKNGT
jgi:hypothetical protein